MTSVCYGMNCNLYHMTFYSVSAVIGYGAGHKRPQKYNNNNNISL